MDVKYQLIFRPDELIFEWRRIRLICFETFTRNPIFGSHFRQVVMPKTCHDISRLEICQKIYTTKFSGERILHTENA